MISGRKHAIIITVAFLLRQWGHGVPASRHILSMDMGAEEKSEIMEVSNRIIFRWRYLLGTATRGT